MGEQDSVTDAVSDVVARARKAQAGWSKLSSTERARRLRRLGRRALDDDELARTITEDVLVIEEGKRWRTQDFPTSNWNLSDIRTIIILGLRCLHLRPIIVY